MTRFVSSRRQQAAFEPPCNLKRNSSHHNSEHADSLSFSGDRSNLSDAALRAYEEARISGLCHDGAMEIALRLAGADDERTPNPKRLGEQAPSVESTTTPPESE